MKPFYAECSRRALHAWANSPNTPLYGISEQVWRTAAQASAAFPPVERAYLVELYRQDAPLAQNIRAAASHYHVSHDELWQLARQAERRVAALLGLI